MAAELDPAIIMARAVQVIQAQMWKMRQQHIAFMEKMQLVVQSVATTQVLSPSIAPWAKIYFKYFSGEIDEWASWSEVNRLNSPPSDGPTFCM